MNLVKLFSGLVVLIIVMIIFSSCKEADYKNIALTGREPVIEPDYSGVTIPRNIAPMNFTILEDGNSYVINAVSSSGTRFTVKASDGKVQFPLKLWKKLLAESQGGSITIEVISEDKDKKLLKYDPVNIRVVDEPLDPYLCYRLLYPGYESWVEMKIVQRSTEDFRESSIFENQLLKDNCVNCHSFKQNQPDRFLLHVRGSMGGTYFVNGEKITRTALRTENMPANAVYPSWHPSGKYVAFSSNKTVQSFHMHTDKNIEVLDMYSSMFVYDVEKNGMSGLPVDDTIKYMETFPCWSPEGNYLYYCRTVQVKEGYDYKGVKYDLVRRSFDPALSLFGKAEVVFNAFGKNKSVSFPSVSPDGQFLVFTLHDYGTFSIWHKEADLYLMNLKNGKVDKMSINSNETESWHSWSSNGKWIVFSSKRGDGLTARPYFAYFGSEDSVGKPFVLPQKDPSLYNRLGKTFNRPELVSGKIKTGPRDFMEASKKEALKAKWIGN
jgi:WD40 repeat protein